jgi:hypothetical protein
MDYLANKTTVSILLLLLVIFVSIITDQVVRSYHIDIINSYLANNSLKNS